MELSSSFGYCIVGLVPNSRCDRTSRPHADNRTPQTSSEHFKFAYREILFGDQRNVLYVSGLRRWWRGASRRAMQQLSEHACASICTAEKSAAVLLRHVQAIREICKNIKAILNYDRHGAPRLRFSHCSVIAVARALKKIGRRRSNDDAGDRMAEGGRTIMLCRPLRYQ